MTETETRIINTDPAFPTHPISGDELAGADSGMMLRDYFAACALQGLIVATNVAFANAAALSRRAYEIADAMLVEREREL